MIKNEKQPNWVVQALVIAIITSVVGSIVTNIVTVATFTWAGISHISLPNWGVFIISVVVSSIFMLLIFLLGIFYTISSVDYVFGFVFKWLSGEQTGIKPSIERRWTDPIESIIWRVVGFLLAVCRREADTAGQ